MANEKRRLVVKIGTSSLILPNGRVNLRTVDRLAYTLASLNNQGFQVAWLVPGRLGRGWQVYN